MARKILLADDSVTAQNMGRKILADAGYEVITVNNGSAALKKIAEQKPDLIVLDVYMPGYSGLEVCQRLKEANETSRIPVLLTVGKLEPFKPEEAKRARADAFIVKPFEASELLSALSKLEDKIVPRPESSKPGRFARVTAAIEEGRYDKSVAIQEDVGWKNRISFPHKKNGKSATENGDSDPGYNATESVPKPVEKPRRTKAEETRVDLGALAPEGLPKDVTPEEIAALAAAAAQVKGKIAEARTEETGPIETVLAVPQEVAAATPAATFAEQQPEKIEEKIEEKLDATHNLDATHIEDASSEAAAPSPSDVIAALAGLNPDSAVSHEAALETAFSVQSHTEPAENEPVTMAVAAKTESGGVAPRWKAVSVALDPEEAALSLEHEMQKAYAAYAAAENGHAASVTALPEATSIEAVPASASPALPEPALPEPVVSIPALPAPEAAQALTAVANASTDALRAAVQELEMVAESYVREPAAPPIIQPVSVAEAHQTLEAVAKEAAATRAIEPQPEAAKLDTAKPHDSDSHRDERQHEDRKHVDQQNYEPQNHDRQNHDWPSKDWQNKDGQDKDGQHETWKPEQPSLVAASASPTFVPEVPAERTSAHQDSSHAEATVEPVAERSGPLGEKDSDPATATAAAWASWRRVRESDNPKAASEAPSHQQGTSAPQDAAAMAVAAGAEKAPEEASEESESDPAAIASIVDSVLADLRPKIFEEISRKMGKKK